MRSSGHFPSRRELKKQPKDKHSQKIRTDAIAMHINAFKANVPAYKRQKPVYFLPFIYKLPGFEDWDIQVANHTVAVHRLISDKFSGLSVNAVYQKYRDQNGRCAFSNSPFGGQFFDVGVQLGKNGLRNNSENFDLVKLIYAMDTSIINHKLKIEVNKPGTDIEIVIFDDLIAALARKFQNKNLSFKLDRHQNAACLTICSRWNLQKYNYYNYKPEQIGDEKHAVVCYISLSKCGGLEIKSAVAPVVGSGTIIPLNNPILDFRKEIIKHVEHNYKRTARLICM